MTGFFYDHYWCRNVFVDILNLPIIKAFSSQTLEEFDQNKFLKLMYYLIG